MTVCHTCKNSITVNKVVSRKDVCPFCQADLRCCLNCRFHDMVIYNQCREPQADRVLDKDRSNFCDYFKFSDSNSPIKSQDKGDTVRNKLEDLFK